MDAWRALPPYLAPTGHTLLLLLLLLLVVVVPNKPAASPDPLLYVFAPDSAKATCSRLVVQFIQCSSFSPELLLSSAPVSGRAASSCAGDGSAVVRPRRRQRPPLQHQLRTACPPAEHAHTAFPAAAGVVKAVQLARQTRQGGGSAPPNAMVLLHGLAAAPTPLLLLKPLMRCHARSCIRLRATHTCSRTTRRCAQAGERCSNACERADASAAI